MTYYQHTLPEAMSAQQEKARLAQLEKKRKEMLASYASEKESLLAETARNRTDSARFVTKTDGVEDSLKRSTYGLVQLSDFKETREKLEEQARREAAGASAADAKGKEGKGKKKKKEGKVKLSFAMDDEEEEREQKPSPRPRPAEDQAEEEGTSEERATKRAKLGKNPTVDTYFLPDREREDQERKDRDELRKEWLKMQEDLKQEDVEITYSYWDGNGHRKEVTCKKGDTIAMFLEKCRNQFPELRAVSVDNLMYIKEDLIIPHVSRFYNRILYMVLTSFIPQHYTFCKYYFHPVTLRIGLTFSSTNKQTIS